MIPNTLMRSGMRAPVLAGALLLAGCNQAQNVVLGTTQTLAASGASNPTVASVDGGNGLLVAWVGAGQGGSGWDVYLAHSGADGLPEGEPVRVNDTPGDADPHEQAPAQVAVGPNGEIYVAWQKKIEAPWLDFGGADVRFARSTDGGRTFSPAVTVNDNLRESPARMSFHNVAVAPDGTIYVSWIDARKRDAVREIAYRQKLEAGGEEGAAAPAQTGDAGQDPTHHVAEEPGTEIRMAVSHDGGLTFSPSVVIDGNSCPCCRTGLVAGPDGVLYIAWRKIFDGGIRDIAIARSDDGGKTFSTPTAVHQDDWVYGGCPHAGPSLALDEKGRVHAAWYTGKEDRQGLWYAVSDDGGATFGEPAPILAEDWVPPSQARLAIADGSVWVAWDDRREAAGPVRLARIGEDGRMLQVDTDARGASPMLALGGSNGALVWQDGEAVRLRAIQR